MHKIGFFLSGLLVLMGVGVLLFTSVFNAIIPEIGPLAFQVAAANSSVDYQVDFLFVNLIALAVIVIGTLLAYRFYKNDLL
ncbi:MAG TPA: hypothetical protein GX404_05940 [Syntrophomonadaceae bacterium]|nr:hypothetical protein [Syntrophomonadaceae bacterium]